MITVTLQFRPSEDVLRFETEHIATINAEEAEKLRRDRRDVEITLSREQVLAVGSDRMKQRCHEANPHTPSTMTLAFGYRGLKTFCHALLEFGSTSHVTIRASMLLVQGTIQEVRDDEFEDAQRIIREQIAWPEFERFLPLRLPRTIYMQLPGSDFTLSFFEHLCQIFSRHVVAPQLPEWTSERTDITFRSDDHNYDLSIRYRKEGQDPGRWTGSFLQTTPTRIHTTYTNQTIQGDDLPNVFVLAGLHSWWTIETDVVNIKNFTLDDRRRFAAMLPVTSSPPKRRRFHVKAPEPTLTESFASAVQRQIKTEDELEHLLPAALEFAGPLPGNVTRTLFFETMEFATFFSMCINDERYIDAPYRDYARIWLNLVRCLDDVSHVRMCLNSRDITLVSLTVSESFLPTLVLQIKRTSPTTLEARKPSGAILKSTDTTNKSIYSLYNELRETIRTEREARREEGLDPSISLVAPNGSHWRPLDETLLDNAC